MAVQALKAGDRVRYSKVWLTPLTAGRRNRDAVKRGVVIATSDRRYINVLWDGRMTVSQYAPQFIEIDHIDQGLGM